MVYIILNSAWYFLRNKRISSTYFARESLRDTTRNLIVVNTSYIRPLLKIYFFKYVLFDVEKSNYRIYNINNINVQKQGMQGMSV